MDLISGLQFVILRGLLKIPPRVFCGQILALEFSFG